MDSPRARVTEEQNVHFAGDSAEDDAPSSRTKLPPNWLSLGRWVSSAYTTTALALLRSPGDGLRDGFLSRSEIFYYSIVFLFIFRIFYFFFVALLYSFFS